MFDGSRWEEILREVPLDFRPYYGKVPDGRIVRKLNDLPGTYGDLLKYGNSFRELGFSIVVTTTASEFTFLGTVTASSGPVTFQFPVTT